MIIVFDFFFFKQKTAYEMRISDWSSDVCSSDLDGVAAERPQLPRDRIEQLPVVAARKVRAADRTLEQHVADDRQLRRRVVEDDMARRVTRTMDDIEGQVADRHRIAVVQQIGRAAGRERVGQYVSISVVAVSLEHNIENKGAGKCCYR